MRVPFKCLKCGAGPQKHGKGKCLAGEGRECEGLICECEDYDNPLTDAEDHGESFENKCASANCYHCGWGGTVPAKPKGAQKWEKQALDAGWTPPPGRAKELGL